MQISSKLTRFAQQQGSISCRTKKFKQGTRIVIPDQGCHTYRLSVTLGPCHFCADQDTARELLQRAAVMLTTSGCRSPACWIDSFDR